MKNFLLIFILFNLPIISQVQNPEWRNYIKSECVRSIAEEGNFLWIAAEGGLIKFNKFSHTKEHFNKANSLLPSNFIVSIVIDTNGNKWVGTSNGVVRFKGNDWQVFNNGNSGLSDNKISCITIDHENNKWIGTLDSGLVKYDNTNWVQYKMNNSILPSNKIICLAEFNDTLLIGTQSGVVRRVGDSLSIFNLLGNLKITAFEKDQKGNLWVGTSNQLIKIISSDSVKIFPLPGFINSIKADNNNVKWVTSVYSDLTSGDMSGTVVNVDSSDTVLTFNTNINLMIPNPWFTTIHLDSQGIKWFGSFYGLLKVTNAGELISLSNAPLYSSYAQKIFSDRNQRIWIYNWNVIPLGYQGPPVGYLTKYENNTWTNYTSQNSSVGFCGVSALSEFSATTMYVVMEKCVGSNELYKFSSGIWTKVTNVPQTQGNQILYMWYDAAINRIWVDFWGANGQSNVFQYNGSSWNQVTNFPVYDIAKMKRRGNVVWFASDQGLVKYESGIFTVYTVSNSGLPDNNVNTLDIDGIGNVWVGTSNGLVKFDGINWTIYNSENSPLINDNIIALSLDAVNVVYAVTEWYPYDLGMVKFDGINWEIFNSQNSAIPERIYSWLPSDYSYIENTSIPFHINDLAIDASGKVWLTTDNGIVVYDKNGIPVPVELISFTADNINNHILLSWSTATETNNKGFEIEKCLTQTLSKEEGFYAWERIGFVLGRGTTTEVNKYSFEDKNLLSGRNSYRLKQIDFGGSFEYSNIVEVEVAAPSKFELHQNYPNPFNPSTKISYSVTCVGARCIVPVQLKVFDILGNEVATLVNEYKPAGSYGVEFEASSDSGNLASGIYFYRLQAGSFVGTKKMILLR